MIVTRKLVMTKDIGCNDNLFGGNILAWLDEAGAIWAKMETGEERMVTVKMGEMVFKKPVKVGQVIEFSVSEEIGRGGGRGESSYRFTIHAYVGYDTVASVECVYVCVDENGKKKPIAKWH